MAHSPEQGWPLDKPTPARMLKNSPCSNDEDDHMFTMYVPVLPHGMRLRSQRSLGDACDPLKTPPMRKVHLKMPFEIDHYSEHRREYFQKIKSGWIPTSPSIFKEDRKGCNLVFTKEADEPELANLKPSVNKRRVNLEKKEKKKDYKRPKYRR